MRTLLLLALGCVLLGLATRDCGRDAPDDWPEPVALAPRLEEPTTPNGTCTDADGNALPPRWERP